MQIRTQDEINSEVFSRLEKLERLLTGDSKTDTKKEVMIKKRTLAELIKNKSLKNGQEKVTAIVGYYEVECGKQYVTQEDIRLGWRQAKFNGNYAPELMKRSVKDGLVSDYGVSGNYVLTQTGEVFFNQLTK